MELQAHQTLALSGLLVPGVAEVAAGITALVLEQAHPMVGLSASQLILPGLVELLPGIPARHVPTLILLCPSMKRKRNLMVAPAKNAKNSLSMRSQTKRTALSFAGHVDTDTDIQ
jgi:hypothetical protein